MHHCQGIGNGGYVIIGDGKKCKVIGRGTIGKHPQTILEDVALVEGLAHNLLSVAQLCSKGFCVSFFDNVVHIIRNDIILFKGTALNNIYTINLSAPNNLKCLVVSNETCWLWHRRLGHASMYLISKLVRLNLAREFLESNLRRIIFVMHANMASRLERVTIISQIGSRLDPSLGWLR